MTTIDTFNSLSKHFEPRLERTDTEPELPADAPMTMALLFDDGTDRAAGIVEEVIGDGMQWEAWKCLCATIAVAKRGSAALRYATEMVNRMERLAEDGYRAKSAADTLAKIGAAHQRGDAAEVGRLLGK